MGRNESVFQTRRNELSDAEADRWKRKTADYRGGGSVFRLLKGRSEEKIEKTEKSNK